MKLGLCLSGGGIKGASHVGVLQALEDENIKIDIFLEHLLEVLLLHYMQLATSLQKFTIFLSNMLNK